MAGQSKKKSEENFRLNELNDILSSTPSCLKIITKEGLLLDMNPQGLSLIEAENMESVFKANVYDIVEESHRDKFVQFNERICSGNREHLIFEIVGLKGTRRWMETYAAPYTLPDGQLAHIAITNDITERIQAEEEIKKQKAIAHHQSKLASIGELAAGVGHEINNPLAIVLGYIETLQKKIDDNSQIDPKEIKKVLNRMNTAGIRISKIVQGLRTFSRTDSDEDVLFDPTVTIAESVDLISEMFKRENIHLKLETVDSLNKSLIKGNSGKLHQVLINLLTNARDAVADNEKKEITLRYEASPESVHITISDNGHGIPEELRDKIFDPFFTTKDVNKGTGIGLSLVHNFIAEINGKIKISSEQGVGTSFQIEIPLASQQFSKEEMDSKPTSTREKIQAKVLVVDDEEPIRILLSEILEEFGLTVISASHGKEALELLEKSNSEIDLIISDMKMPVMDGPALLKKIRANKSIEQPAFLFFTGGININFEDKNNPLKSMIDGYFFKPFDRAKIYQLISDILHRENQKSQKAS